MKKVHFYEKGKLYIFPVNIATCKEGGFFASTAILQGAHAEGETYSETLERLEDVIRVHLEARLKDNEFIPSLEEKGEVISNIPLPIRV